MLPSSGSVARLRRRVPMFCRLQFMLASALLLSGCVATSHRREPLPNAADPPTYRPGAPGEPGELPLSVDGAQFQAGVAATPDVPTNIRVTVDSPNVMQSESVIVVDPANPAHLVGLAIDYRRDLGRFGIGYYVSFDGGLVWQEGMLNEPSYQLQADPAVAFCPDGSVVAILLSYNLVIPGAAIVMFRSADGGITWPTRRVVTNQPAGTPGLDKPWIACDDTTSPFRGRIYSGYTETGAAGTRLMVKRSTDSGASWSSASVISDSTSGSRNGVNFAVGAAGQLYAAWTDFATSSIKFDRSIDGGVTWGGDVVVSPSTLIDEFAWGGNSLPTLAIDRTSSPFAGSLYVAWADMALGNADILLSHSRDGGAVWSTPQRVNDDAPSLGVDQWLPAVAVDPQGHVSVAYFDRRHDRFGQKIETWGAISRDGGVTFDRNIVFSDVAQDGTYTDFLGHYMSMTSTSQFLYPLWADTRSATGGTDQYTDRYPNRFRYDEVVDVRFADHAQLDWQTQDARFGVPMTYDLISGRLQDLLTDHGFTNIGCFASDLSGPPQSDTRLPALGDGYYYLVRASGPNGVGSWGDGQPRRRSDERDPLEEPTGSCP